MKLEGDVTVYTNESSYPCFTCGGNNTIEGYTTNPKIPMFYGVKGIKKLRCLSCENEYTMPQELK